MAVSLRVLISRLLRIESNPLFVVVVSSAHPRADFFILRRDDNEWNRAAKLGAHFQRR